MTHHTRPTLGVLAGWQFYWTATPLSYLNPIFHGIRSAAHDRGCNVLFACGMGPSANPTDPLRPAWPVPLPDADFVPVGPWNTDGLIAINPLQSPERSAYIRELRAAGHPVVFVGSGERGSTIVADNAGGIRSAMQHLVEHGHQRIAFIAGTLEDLGGDSGDRLRAYQAAVRDFQLADEQALITFGRHVYDGGYQAMQRLLADDVPFSAVLASNDESALGALQALKEAGRRVPHEVALIGFDDRPESAIQTPALSSVQIPLFKLGYQAVDMILQQIDHQPDASQLIRVPTRLVRRESCGCGRVSRSASFQLAGQNNILPDLIDAVSREAQHTSADEIQRACEELLAAFTTDRFEATLERILTQAAAQQEDISIWQAAISILSEIQPARSDQIDQARLLIAEHLQQQHRQTVVDQQWRIDRLGVLTAHLLSALDEVQIFDVLAQHLPEMSIPWAGLAFFEAEGTDRLAASRLHLIPSQNIVRFASHEFPPTDLNLIEPFSLALLPLTHQRGLSGFAVFNTSQLELYGAIVQQMAAALNNAQLYREATEGRRLAEEASQLKSRFLSTVSHELRTPLNLIVGLSDLLLKESDESGSPLPDRYHVDIERIHASGQHLGWLISDVLDLASSEAGQLRLSNDVIDLSETLRTVIVIGQQLTEDKGLAWSAALPEADPWVYGDRTRLRQVALNLVANAVKFTRHGEVRLTVEAHEDAVTVAVSDTGLGIALEEQEKIFDEFRRSERTLSRGYGGLGLGLAICKRLIELHGGTIGVSSSGEEGHGSTFCFTLPIVPPPPTVFGDVLARNASAVVVLTNRSSSDRLHDHLRLRGFDVHVIVLEDTPDWSTALGATQPSAVILDSGLVPQQGWEVLKVLKSRPATQHTPVLFYSLEHESGSILELDYLTKPIALHELKQALDQQWAGSDQSGKAILIVDDDPHTMEMHARLVQSHANGHRILKAHHGREALDVSQREPIDLVLLDLMMPELDGFGVLAAMHDNPATRDIPVIVLTGQALTEKDMARLNRGVATVLRKGLFSVEETLAHLDAALERKRKLSVDAQRLVRQAMAYLHEHYAEAISRDDLARHVGMSDDYLTHCFRQEVGMTPIAYLNRYRVDQAKQLLKDTSQSITDIALAVGFSDSGYFSRVFRREVGLSPEAFRKEKG